MGLSKREIAERKQYEWNVRFLERQSKIMANGGQIPTPTPTPTPRSVSPASPSEVSWVVYSNGYDDPEEQNHLLEMQGEKKSVLTRSRAKLLGVKPDDSELPVFLGKRFQRKTAVSATLPSSPSGTTRATKKTNSKGGKSPGKTVSAAGSPKKGSSKSKAGSRRGSSVKTGVQSKKQTPVVDFLRDDDSFHMQVDPETDDDFIERPSARRSSRPASRATLGNHRRCDVPRDDITSVLPSREQHGCASAAVLPRVGQRQRQRNDADMEGDPSFVPSETNPANHHDDVMPQSLAATSLIGTMGLLHPSSGDSSPIVRTDEQNNPWLCYPLLPDSELPSFRGSTPEVYQDSEFPGTSWLCYPLAQDSLSFQQPRNMITGNDFEQIPLERVDVLQRQESYCSVDIPHEGVDGVEITMCPHAVDWNTLAIVQAFEREKTQAKTNLVQ